MMYILQATCLITLACIASGHNYNPDGSHIDYRDVSMSLGQPWPHPQQYVSTSDYMKITSGNFKFVLNKNCPILEQAIQRYNNTIFQDKCLSQTKKHKVPIIMDREALAGNLYNISISVYNSCEEWPYMDMDEQYLLKVNSPDMPGEALLFTTTVWGALRGLETFSQLVYSIGNGQFAINSTMVLDYPRFSHRGLMLDTARHYVPVGILLQNLEAMAQNKMNVFHWHIVDDQSFPYVSQKFPSMSAKGAYIPETHIYTPSDVSQVIEFARQRGIRVLVEFDSPGHTESWGKSQSTLLTSCYKNGKPDGTYGPVNPINNSTYSFLEEFFSEVSSVFKDKYIHLGGDEVSFDCWKSNPDVNNFMTKQGFPGDYAKLEEFYMQRLLDIVGGLNRSYIVWQEVFDNGVQVKPDTVIHVWKDPRVSELEKVTAAGYKTLLSTCWYLNYISYGENWPAYYACDPQDFNGTTAQKNLIMGGEACMWAEFVDGTNLISRTWPRASAVAERLWSDKDLTDVNAAASRMEEHRCRMLMRGLRVEPPNGPGYCPCDYAVV